MAMDPQPETPAAGATLAEAEAQSAASGGASEAEDATKPTPDPKRWQKAAIGLVAAVLLGAAATYVAQFAGEGKMAAKVDGQVIGQKRHAALVAQLRATYLSSTQLPPGSALPPEQEAQMGREAMGKLVEAALIEQEAKLRGVVITPAQVDAKEKEVMDGFQGVEKFEAALKQAGVSRADVRQRMEEGLRAEALAVAVAGDAAMVKPEEAKAYYTSHGPEFQVAEQRRGKHILVSSEDEAKAIIAKLKGGASFDDLARSLSLDTGSGAQGGDLGYFGKGRMVAPFEAAAFSMKPGQLSAPVKTRFGYHVILLTEIKPGHTLPYAQVEAPIMERLAGQKRQQAFVAWLESRRLAARIEYAPGFDPTSPQGAPAGLAPGGARGEDTRGHAPSAAPPAGAP